MTNRECLSSITLPPDDTSFLRVCHTLKARDVYCDFRWTRMIGITIMKTVWSVLYSVILMLL